MNITLQIPNMRDELCDWLEALSDFEHQKNVWHDGNPAHGMDNFDNVIHFIYDDTTLRKDPESDIGVFLYNMKEVQAVKILTGAIDLIFSKYGKLLRDDEYIHLPEWADVLSAAQALRRMICPAQSPAGDG